MIHERKVRKRSVTAVRWHCGHEVAQLIKADTQMFTSTCFATPCLQLPAVVHSRTARGGEALLQLLDRIRVIGADGKGVYWIDEEIATMAKGRLMRRRVADDRLPQADHWWLIGSLSHRAR
jgi:hypothetical protein